MDGPQTLGVLTFVNSAGNTAGYTLAAGTSGSLTMDNSGSTAQINVGSGSHSIAACVVLARNLTVAPSAGTMLLISGNLSESSSGKSLTLNGPGTLALAGSAGYTGGTTLAAGILLLSNSLALQNSTLTPSGGTLAFDPAVATHAFILGGLSGGGNIALTDGSNPVTLNVGNNNASTSYGGALTGSGALTKIGSGTLTLTTANMFSGNTLINGGTLTLSNAGALRYSTLDTSGAGLVSFDSLTSGTLGGLTGPGLLTLSNAASAALALSVGNNNGSTTYSGVLNGSGSLTKIGAGSLTLTNTNTYTGTTTIIGGTLVLTNSGALQYSTLDTSGMGVLSFGSLTSGMLGGLRGSGPLVLSNAASAALVLSVGNNNAATTYSGVLSGGGGLTKVGTGLLTLTNTNNFTGTTLIGGGTLALAGGRALQYSSLYLSGTGAVSFGAITSETIGGLAGTGPLALSSAVTGALSLYVGNNGANTTYSGGLSGSGSLTKIGFGGLYLAGSNTYSGPTTVTAGRLVAGAANALSPNSALAMSAGTLDVSGFAQTVKSLSLSGTGFLNLAAGNLLTSTGTAGLAGDAQRAELQQRDGGVDGVQHGVGRLRHSDGRPRGLPSGIPPGRTGHCRQLFGDVGHGRQRKLERRDEMERRHRAQRRGAAGRHRRGDQRVVDDHPGRTADARYADVCQQREQHGRIRAGRGKFW